MLLHPGEVRRLRLHADDVVRESVALPERCDAVDDPSAPTGAELDHDERELSLGHGFEERDPLEVLLVGTGRSASIKRGSEKLPNCSISEKNATRVRTPRKLTSQPASTSPVHEPYGSNTGCGGVSRPSMTT